MSFINPHITIQSSGGCFCNRHFIIICFRIKTTPFKTLHVLRNTYQFFLGTIKLKTAVNTAAPTIDQIIG